MKLSMYFIITVTLISKASVALSQDWKQAEKEIIKLSLSKFPELPNDIRLLAVKKGCQIPQSFALSKPHNVIQGSFASKGGKDWALLCSKNGKSSIFIIFGEKQTCSNEIAIHEDHNFLQKMDEKNKLRYSRVLSIASVENILKHQKAYGGPLPYSMDHQGIDDAFIEKASTIYYCENGKWLSLTGSD